MSGSPAGDYVNALRWFKHISSFAAAETATFTKADFEVTVAGGAAAAPARPAKKVVEEEEVDEEAERIKAERLAAYAEKKSKKPALIAKSNVILDIKPWDDETDLGEMEKAIRTIEGDGLLWGKAEKKPIAYGVFKLTISAVVEDDKISVDWMEEKICEFEDYVQSVDVAAF